MLDHRTTPALPRSTAAGMAAGTATLIVAGACWIAAVQQMRGMNMGVATDLGSFGSFVAAWVSMMAAMMLPSAVPAVASHADGAAATAMFVASYLAVWTLFGIATYPIYRPHGSGVAGVIVLAAGLYELTPLKRYFRRRCHADVRSGLEFGLCCVGSSIGLMAMLLALGVMSIAWMSILAAVVLAQKLLPPKLALDVPLALAIVGLGIWIVLAPSSVPGLMASM